MEKITDGQAWVAVNADAQLHNATGVLHGGVLAGLANTAMACAFGSQLEGTSTGTSTDLSVQFLRSTFEGRLVAHATVRPRGRVRALLACTIKGAAGRLVAEARANFVVLDAADAVRSKR